MMIDASCFDTLTNDEMKSQRIFHNICLMNDNHNNNDNNKQVSSLRSASDLPAFGWTDWNLTFHNLSTYTSPSPTPNNQTKTKPPKFTTHSPTNHQQTIWTKTSPVSTKVLTTSLKTVTKQYLSKFIFHGTILATFVVDTS